MKTGFSLKHPPRVLITGGTGLLGKALLETAPAGLEVDAAFHQNPPPFPWHGRFHPLEICDEASVNGLMKKVEPHVVIHAASIGSVDEAQRDPLQVKQVNVGGTRNLVQACRLSGSFLVLVSSNAVFDGTLPPYAEDSPLRAANRYGEIKIEAEAVLRESGIAGLIVRPILMYGWPFPNGRDNVVTRWLSHLEREETVEVAQDITSMPLSALDCAQTIWAGIGAHCTGIVHVAGADRVSLVTFAKETARVFGCDERLIVPVPSSRLRGLAPRPRDTSFVTTRMQRELGIRPLGIREGLTLMQRSRALVS